MFRKSFPFRTRNIVLFVHVNTVWNRKLICFNIRYEQPSNKFEISLAKNFPSLHLLTTVSQINQVFPRHRFRRPKYNSSIS